MKILFLSVLLALAPFSHRGAVAEVEYEIGSKEPFELSCFRVKTKGVSGGLYGSEYTGFPILIRLTDGDKMPVANAVVVLKRLGPDGWTEEELKREAKARTDENGMMVVHYPGPARADEKGVRRMEILGAVTVIAEGHGARMVELKDFFKDGQHTLADDSAPLVRIELKN